jgi:hypothetical protein
VRSVVIDAGPPPMPVPVVDAGEPPAPIRLLPGAPLPEGYAQPAEKPTTPP